VTPLSMLESAALRASTNQGAAALAGGNVAIIVGQFFYCVKS
jgi:hypothetical protein